MKVYICTLGERCEGSTPYAVFADKEAALKQLKTDAEAAVSDYLDAKIEEINDGWMVGIDVYKVREFEVL